MDVLYERLSQYVDLFADVCRKKRIPVFPHILTLDLSRPLRNVLNLSWDCALREYELICTYEVEDRNRECL